MKITKENRSQFVPKVGMKVKIRSWDDLVREFGTNPAGNINCPNGFIQRMLEYCGEVKSIAIVFGDNFYFNDTHYIFSVEMIEEVIEETKEKEIMGKDYKAMVHSLEKGMEIRVRGWDDLVAEFGLDDDGDIDPAEMYYCFTESCDRKYCGMIGTVKDYDTEDGTVEVRFPNGTSADFDIRAITLDLDLKYGDRVDGNIFICKDKNGDDAFWGDKILDKDGDECVIVAMAEDYVVVTTGNTSYSFSEPCDIVLLKESQPEPKSTHIPYTLEDMLTLVGRKYKVAGGDELSTFEVISWHGGVLMFDYMTPEEFLKSCVWEDSTPCGKKVSR